MKKLAATIAQEPMLLVFVVLCAGGVWAFVELAEEVGEGDSHAIDEWMILALRDPQDTSDPVGPKWFEEMMRDFTALGGYAILTPLTCLVSLYLWVRGRPHMALLVIAAAIGGIILSSILKSYFDRPRPDLVLHHSHVLTKSFPSGHAMMAATTYLMLGAILAQAEKQRALKAFFLGLGIALAVVVGVSRIYLGVHWPTDVLAGWVAGAAWALFCWTLGRVLVQRQRH